LQGWVRHRCSSYHSGTDTAAYSTVHGEVTEQKGVAIEQDDDMHAMLRDAFGVHDVAEAVSTDPQQVEEDTSCGDALKYQELLKTAEKPFHPGTKHSKLSATVHMYNLKCVGGLSNKIFSDTLEFINQLLPPCDEALPDHCCRARWPSHVRSRADQHSWTLELSIVEAADIISNRVHPTR
jgi:hypothetical protein